LRHNLYHAQDEIDKRKENLIDEIEARLKQKIEAEELFLVKWRVI
jgi:ATP phosphoribosyltransferase